MYRYARDNDQLVIFSTFPHFRTLEGGKYREEQWQAGVVKAVEAAASGRSGGKWRYSQQGARSAVSDLERI